MTNKICRPFYDASPALITQKFGANPNPIQPNGHTGLDIVPQYPLRTAILVAPCKVKITNIVNNLNLEVNDEAELRKGFGIAMKPLEGDYPPNTFFLYWHCRPVFPVQINDVVEQGQPVAQMGNSGYVMVGGQYVPIADRNTIEAPGTHVHFEYFIGDAIQGRQYMDVLPLIDWTIPIVQGNSFLNAIQAILNTIKNILKT